jgi:hypothetical protein
LFYFLLFFFEKLFYFLLSLEASGIRPSPTSAPFPLCLALEDGRLAWLHGARLFRTRALPPALEMRHHSPAAASRRRAPVPSRRLLRTRAPRRRCATARRTPETSPRPLRAINRPLLVQTVARGAPTSPPRLRLAHAMQGRGAGKRTIQEQSKLPETSHEYISFSCLIYSASAVLVAWFCVFPTTTTGIGLSCS